MVKVCAHYQETTILLEEFEQKPEAEEFMLHPYYIVHDDGDEEIVYPDEMFIEEDDTTNVGKNNGFADLDPNDLPY